MAQGTDLTIFVSTRESSCEERGEDLSRRAWITRTQEQGALCPSCADLDHLVFLPAGDATLTRRARKHATLVAVVLRWSRTRKRHERQGLIVEEAALDQAERECLADAEIRERRREQEAVRRAELDRQYVERFAARVRELFPACPPGREMSIAEHAGLKYSGRVGRSASAKSLNEGAVRLSVVAHVRHADTKYDRLLVQGYDRWDARSQVEEEVARVLSAWEVPRLGTE